ncbi:ZNF845 [Symbiodinium necroappetens]|uniref:ZNF845 protein n=1 Tax=Symbiodinium necroappetens TaxID=1628268 RepID=A0A813CKD3_9DINO|nr:ZNF845 [Symbiodinium necroappetens]
MSNGVEDFNFGGFGESSEFAPPAWVAPRELPHIVVRITLLRSGRTLLLTGFDVNICSRNPNHFLRRLMDIRQPISKQRAQMRSFQARDSDSDDELIGADPDEVALARGDLEESVDWFDCEAVSVKKLLPGDALLNCVPDSSSMLEHRSTFAASYLAGEKTQPKLRIWECLGLDDWRRDSRKVDPPPPPPVERRAQKARGSKGDEKREEKVRIVYPRECPHCSKSFPSSTRYHKHVSFHTAAKSFKCDHPGCNKAYKRKVDLEDHKAVHLEVKPFRCTVESCDRSFTTKQSLMSHIGRVHNGLSCTACGLRFRKKAKLQQHWAIVHGARGAHEADGSKVEPGKCPDCGKTFQHRESLEKCAGGFSSQPCEGCALFVSAP